MTEVEIIWPASLTRTRLGDVADELESGGVATTCRIQPVRRGPESAVLILMTSAALEPLLRTLFQRVGEDAYGALKRFIGVLFGAPAEKTVSDAPQVAIFRSAVTGAEFLFTAHLPNEALQKALELDPGEGPGRWMWDERTGSWLRFEEPSRQGVET